MGFRIFHILPWISGGGLEKLAPSPVQRSRNELFDKTFPNTQPTSLLPG